MDIREFAKKKTGELRKYLSLWAQEFDFGPRQSLAIRGFVNGLECTVTVEGIDKKSRSKAIDRSLTKQEIEAIGSIKSFSRAQREFVDIFLKSGNKPKIRRSFIGWGGIPEQVNRIIKREGLDISFCAFYPENKRRVPHWEQELCFRPVTRT